MKETSSGASVKLLNYEAFFNPDIDETEVLGFKISFRPSMLYFVSDL